MSYVVLPVLFLLLTPEAPAVTHAPPRMAADPDYESCLAQVFKNIPEGREFAARWASEGGGASAQHCLALADLAAGFPKVAAIRLEELSERSDAGDPSVRAGFLSQAALAWVEAREPAEAERSIAAAFALAPDADQLFLPAASVYAAQEKRQATIDAVTTAETRGQTSSDGYVLRGRARYALTEYRAAADDVIAALKLDPTNVDALVLRGDLAQQGIDIKADYSRAVGKKK